MWLTRSRLPGPAPEFFRSATARAIMLAMGGALVIGGAASAPIRLAVVDGASMEPALRPGQILLCERGRSRPQLQRGDIVLARVKGEVCVKRVFAVGGDRFWQATTDRQDDTYPQLLEPSAPVSVWKRRYPRFRFSRVSVPPHTVFLVGEGVTSIDSRSWGPVPEAWVLGRVLLPSRSRDDGWMRSVAWLSPPRRPVMASRS